MANTEAPDVPETVEIRRSTRRRRTVSARLEGDRVVVLMPAGLTADKEQEHVTTLLKRLNRRANKALRRDGDLMLRAAELSQIYLDGIPAPTSVLWVSNQNFRWGSCTPRDRTIRITHRLKDAPQWVLDAVLVHELAHLIEPGHGPQFTQWLRRYPRYEQAQGFLQGVAWTQRTFGDDPLAGGLGAVDPDSCSLPGCD